MQNKSQSATVIVQKRTGVMLQGPLTSPFAAAMLVGALQTPQLIMMNSWRTHLCCKPRPGVGQTQKMKVVLLLGSHGRVSRSTRLLPQMRQRFHGNAELRRLLMCFAQIRGIIRRLSSNADAVGFSNNASRRAEHAAALPRTTEARCPSHSERHHRGAKGSPWQAAAVINQLLCSGPVVLQGFQKQTSHGQFKVRAQDRRSSLPQPQQAAAPRGQWLTPAGGNGDHPISVNRPSCAPALPAENSPWTV